MVGYLIPKNDLLKIISVFYGLENSALLFNIVSYMIIFVEKSEINSTFSTFIFLFLAKVSITKRQFMTRCHSTFTFSLQRCRGYYNHENTDYLISTFVKNLFIFLSIILRIYSSSEEDHSIKYKLCLMSCKKISNTNTLQIPTFSSIPISPLNQTSFSA